MRKFKAFKSASNFMLLGFLSSFLGTMIIEGSIPSLIALGWVPLTWIPIYATFTRLLDSSSFLLAGYISRFKAENILVFCECFDILMSASAVLVIWLTPATPLLVLPVYLLSISFTPTLMDLAEGMYAEKISRSSETRAANFNARLLMFIPVASSIIARPLGNLIVEISIVYLITANILFSCIGLWCRVISIRHSDHIEHDSNTGHLDERWWDLSCLRELLDFSPGAALLIPTLTITTGFTSTYLTIWLSQGFENTGTAIAFIVMTSGFGLVFGAWAGRRAIKVFSFSANVAGCLVALLSLNAAALLIIAFKSPGEPEHLNFVITFVLYLFLHALFFSWIHYVNVTARQKRYSGKKFSNAIGLSHTLSSIAFIVGTWLGLVLDIVNDPLPAFLISLMLIIVCLYMLNFRDHLRFEGG